MTKKDKFKCFQAFVADKIGKGTRQTDLAKCVGCSNSTIHHLYVGNIEQFRLSWQRKVAKYFGLSLSELIRVGEKLIYTQNQIDSLKDKDKVSQQVDPDTTKKPEIHIHIHISEKSNYVAEVMP